MQLHSSSLLALTLTLSGLLPAGSADTLDRRIAVSENKLSEMTGYLAFTAASVGASGKLLMSESRDGNAWTQWVSVNNSVPLTSNPAACLDPVTMATWVFGQGVDGQAYQFSQNADNKFIETKLSSALPVDLEPTQFSQDPVKCVILGKLMHLFARSQSSKSRVYWTYSNGSSPLSWTAWKEIGSSDDDLKFDPFVVVNSFVERLEVFGVFTSGYVLHTWQETQTKFANKWDRLGGLFSPKFNSAPVVHQMSDDFFNGILQLFVRGEDGGLHHIKQTTCDMVQNPWGPCTWDLWFSSLGGRLPGNSSNPNPFSINRNIHLGIELFSVGLTDLHLYHLWQLDRGGSWEGWEDLGPLSPSSGFHSLPAVILGTEGWWQAFALNSSGGVDHYVQTPLSFSVSSSSVAYGDNVTVSWSVPVDEATHQDWIGVYPTGAANDFYVDFSYVGGTQNPRKDAVPKGALNFTMLLPNGKYDYRYLVNKQYTAVLQASTSTYNYTTASEWVQVYEGIAQGLGSISTNITACVDDGNATVESFRASFNAFENREIFLGLHLFAEGLEDLRDALVQCDETAIVEDLTKFIEALIACTESDCTKFAIDVGLEIVILYEHIYEIYGDIQAASTCFKLDAYQQGGVSIGRVTNACLTIQ